MESGLPNWSDCSERYSPERAGSHRIPGRTFLRLDSVCSTYSLAHYYLVTSSGKSRHGTEYHAMENNEEGQWKRI
jgi:hypothetical protein